MAQNETHIQMTIKTEHIVQVDNWRQKHSVVPSRTAAIRYMFEKGLEQELKKDRI